MSTTTINKDHDLLFRFKNLARALKMTLHTVDNGDGTVQVEFRGGWIKSRDFLNAAIPLMERKHREFNDHKM